MNRNPIIGSQMMYQSQPNNQLYQNYQSNPENNMQAVPQITSSETPKSE